MEENVTTQHAWREDRDENNPAPERYRLPLLINNTSVRLSAWLSAGDSNSSSSKSISPDHVVPSDKGLVLVRHRSATSSGSSSPQTDGSLSFRRDQGSDDSRISSIPCGADQASPSQVSSPQPTGGQRRTSTAGTPGRPRKPTCRNKLPRTTTGKPRSSQKKLATSDLGDDTDSDYVIRCICGFSDILGDQIQCDICQVWQHFACMGIKLATVPASYLCESCDPISFRPLRSEEARELHRIMLRDHAAQSDSKQTVKSTANRRAKRNKSTEAHTDNVPAAVAASPGQTDLILPEKQRIESSSVLSRHAAEPLFESSSVATSAAGKRGQKHRMEELSRDDRKILQYEQMFKRMDERKDKKEKRKRNPDDFFNGSPPRDFDHAGNESHYGEMTNPPLSPLPPPLPSPLELIDVSGCFATPLEATPVKTKITKTKCGGPVVVVGTDVEPTDKARYSLRLRSGAAVKTADADETSKIELNCAKKRKKKEEGDGGGLEDEDSGVWSSLPKRRPRPVSLIDNYYSAMAEIQTENEPQKASRRNRAYSISEEWERRKVEQERSRLYRMYGLKKAVCTRYVEKPNGKPSAPGNLTSKCLTVAEVEAFGKYPLNMGRQITAETLECASNQLKSEADSPVQRLKAVWTMIEESVKNNIEMQRAYRAGQVMANRNYPSESQKTGDARGSMQVAPGVGINFAPISQSGMEQCTQLEVFKVPETRIAAVGQVVTQASIPAHAMDFPSVIASKAQVLVIDHLLPPFHDGEKEAQPEKDEHIGQDMTALTVPIKLSLSEYKQRKLQSQRSSECLLPSVPVVSSAPIVMPVIISTLPQKIQHLSTALTPPPQRTSVIQRVGTINNAKFSSPNQQILSLGPAGQPSGTATHVPTGSTAKAETLSCILSTSSPPLSSAPLSQASPALVATEPVQTDTGNRKPKLSQHEHLETVTSSLYQQNFRPPRCSL